MNEQKTENQSYMMNRMRMTLFKLRRSDSYDQPRDSIDLSKEGEVFNVKDYGSSKQKILRFCFCFYVI